MQETRSESVFSIVAVGVGVLVLVGVTLFVLPLGHLFDRSSPYRIWIDPGGYELPPNFDQFSVYKEGIRIAEIGRAGDSYVLLMSGQGRLHQFTALFLNAEQRRFDVVITDSAEIEPLVDGDSIGLASDGAPVR